jgi:hypothetical protein
LVGKLLGRVVSAGSGDDAVLGGVGEVYKSELGVIKYELFGGSDAVAVRNDHYVLGLDVVVRDSELVHVGKRGQDLVREGFHVLHTERLLFAERELVEIVVEEVKNKRQTVYFEWTVGVFEFEDGGDFERKQPRDPGEQFEHVVFVGANGFLFVDLDRDGIPSDFALVDHRLPAVCED